MGLFQEGRNGAKGSIDGNDSDTIFFGRFREGENHRAAHEDRPIDGDEYQEEAREWLHVGKFLISIFYCHMH